MKLVIFGCGTIAHRIARSCKLVKGLELVGFGSKDPKRAKAYAEQYDCPEYGDYDYFLNSDVDAVYVATYNPSHYDVVRQCLDHHKHVICEKPMFSSKEEYDELFGYAEKQGLLIMEALKSVFLPLNKTIREMVQRGDLGEIRHIYASFVNAKDFPDEHWIHQKKTGGVIKDLGTYCIGTMNFILGRKPKLLEKRSNATADRAETDAWVRVDYDGIEGIMEASSIREGKSALIIEGSRGTLEAENFWKSGKAVCVIDGQQRELETELISDFYYELEHFRTLFEQKKLRSDIMSLQASKDILEITE